MGLGAKLALAAVASVVALIAAYGVDVSPKPPLLRLPAATAFSDDALTADADARQRARLVRRIKRFTLRVRNVSCAGVATGSGWAIDHQTVITNRHVLAGADKIELNTWDGASLTGDVSSARVARLVDIGTTVVDDAWLPGVARMGPPPKRGAPVTAVGFPLGGRLTLSKGRLVRYRDGRRLTRDIAFDGRVMEISAKVKHGNSGGPLLDAQGRVVGVVYAGEPGRTPRSAARTAYAIPITAMRELIRRGGERRVVGCAA